MPPKSDPPIPRAMDIREKYKGNECQQLAALRTIRPHNGLLATITRNRDERHMRVAARDRDVFGLDALPILVRQLISFGFSSQYDSSTTSAEKYLLETTAWKDLGWDQDEDWMTKRELLQRIWPKMTHEQATLDSTNFTIRRLLSEPSLTGMLRTSSDFRLFKHVGLFEPDDKANGTSRVIDWPDSVDDLNTEDIWWDGRGPIQDFVSRRFAKKRANLPGHSRDSGDPAHAKEPNQAGPARKPSDILGWFYPAAARPKFMRILFRPDTAAEIMQAFRSYVTFEMALPTLWPRGEMDGSYDYGVQTDTYKICAIIRSVAAGTGVKDDIRLYWKNGEVIDQQIVGADTTQIKGPGDSNWSITSDIGDYMLFYYRVAPQEDSNIRSDVSKPLEKLENQQEPRMAPRVPAQPSAAGTVPRESFDMSRVPTGPRGTTTQVRSSVTRPRKSHGSGEGSVNDTPMGQRPRPRSNEGNLAVDNRERDSDIVGEGSRGGDTTNLVSPSRGREYRGRAYEDTAEPNMWE